MELEIVVAHLLLIMIQKPLPLPLPSRRFCCQPYLCGQLKYGANLCEWWIQQRLVVATRIGFQCVSKFLLWHRLVQPSMGLCLQRNLTMVNPTNPYTTGSQCKTENKQKCISNVISLNVRMNVISAYFNVSFFFGQFHCFFANLFIFIANTLHIFCWNDTLVNQFFWIDFKACVFLVQKVIKRISLD